MDLKSQKNIAARVLKCGRSRVWLDPARIGDISEAITTADIKRLIKDDVIKKLPKKGISSYRKNLAREQKRKGRKKGKGSRRGSFGTRLSRKKNWIKKIRALRKMARELKEKGIIVNSTYRNVYLKSKSGFFRSRSHMMTYLERNNLLNKEAQNVSEKKGEKNQL